jgi:hypothetical protein
MLKYENKKAYIFAERHEEKLRSAFQDRVLAFNIDSIYPFKRNGIVEEPKLWITVCKSRLPRHCKLELVEAALTALEKYPGDMLLTALTCYTENDVLERRMLYWMMFLVTLTLAICLCTFATLYAVFPLLVIAVFSWSLNIFTFPTLISLGALTASTYFLVSTEDHPNTRVKFGRWVGDLIKGRNRKLADLTALEKIITDLIENNSNVRKTVEKPVEVPQTQLDAKETVGKPMEIPQTRLNADVMSRNFSSRSFFSLASENSDRVSNSQDDNPCELTRMSV